MTEHFLKFKCTVEDCGDGECRLSHHVGGVSLIPAQAMPPNILMEVGSSIFMTGLAGMVALDSKAAPGELFNEIMAEVENSVPWLIARLKARGFVEGARFDKSGLKPRSTTH